MSYATIENHMVYPAADDEAFYEMQDQSNVDPFYADDSDYCLHCKTRIGPNEYGRCTELPAGFLHDTCLEHDDEDRAGFRIVSFALWCIAVAIIAVAGCLR